MSSEFEVSFYSFLSFQIFTFSTKLRNSSTKEASQIQLDIWTNCLQSTTWDELKFDKVRTDFDGNFLHF